MAKLSNTEAEYIALSVEGRKASYSKQFVHFSGAVGGTTMPWRNAKLCLQFMRDYEVPSCHSPIRPAVDALLYFGP